MKRKWPTYGLVAGILLVGAYIGANAYVKTLGSRVRSRVVKALAARFDADVELVYLDIALLPQPTVVGEGLTIRQKGRAGAPPLIRIRRFSAQTDLVSALGAKNEVRLLTLEGLELHIPAPGRVVPEGPGVKRGAADRSAGQDRQKLKFDIQNIVADGTRLIIDPAEQDKLPLQFEITKLDLRRVGPNRPLAFVSDVNNAKPPGLIHSTGHFGPWQRDEPRSTPVDGDYQFTNADLRVFEGIAGTLESHGHYGGVLERIVADGVTDTPNFAVKRAGTPVDLKTKFHAIVSCGPSSARFLLIPRARSLKLCMRRCTVELVK